MASLRDLTTLDDKLVGAFGKLSKLPKAASQQVRRLAPTKPRVSQAVQTIGKGALRGAAHAFNVAPIQRAMEFPKVRSFAKDNLKRQTRDYVRFGISAYEAPRDLKTLGRTQNRKWYQTPVGRVNSFQSEALNRTRRGDPLWKAIGNPALEATLSGLDIGAGLKAATGLARQSRFLPREGRAIARDLSTPLFQKRYVPGVIDRIPAHYQLNKPVRLLNQDGNLFVPPDALAKGQRLFGGVFQRGREPIVGDPKLFMNTQRFVPEQVIERGGRMVREPFRPESNLIRGLMRPGMNVQNINFLPPGEQRLLLGMGRKFTPAEAKRIFRKTGEAVDFQNVLRPNTKPLEFGATGANFRKIPVRGGERIAKNISLGSPDVNTGRTLSPLRKFITSGGRTLRESGPSGQRLEALMREQQMARDLKLGGFNKRISDVFNGLSKSEKLNVTDVLEGTAKPVSNRAAQAAKSMREFYDEIAQEAMKGKFEVRTPTGSVPFKPRENYAPRIYDFDALTKGRQRKKALEHMVKTGQARNLAEAEKLLDGFISANAQRRAGNLENARLFDLPGYEKNAEQAARRYAQSVADRFTEAEKFGRGDETVANLINRISQEGGDYNEAQKIFDYMYQGLPKNKAVSAATQFNLATKLDLGAITNLSQGVNTITKGGFKDFAKGLVKGFTKEGDDLAELANVYDDLVAVKETGVNPAKLVRAIMYPFGKVERFNRRTAANTGKFFAERMAKKIAKNPDNAFAIRQLQSLGLDPQKIAKGGLTSEDILVAANRFSELTQFKPNVLNTPRLWKTPVGRLAMQFKSFSYMQTRFITNEIAKEASKGNFAPLARFLMVVPLASVATQSVRNMVTGRSEKSDATSLDIRDWDKYVKAGGSFFSEPLAQGQFLADTFKNPYASPLKKISRAAGTFGGPTVGEVGNFLTALESKGRIGRDNNMFKQDRDENLELKRYASGQIPFVGELIKNKAFAFPESKKDIVKRLAGGEGKQAVPGVSTARAEELDSRGYPTTKENFRRIKNLFGGDSRSDVEKLSEAGGFTEYFGNKPQGIEGLGWESDKKSKAKSLILDEEYRGLPEETKQELWKKMGYTRDDVEWFVIDGAQNNAERAPFIASKLRNASGEDIKKLIESKRLTEDRAEKMYEGGYISEKQADLLIRIIKSYNKQLKNSKPGGKKGKKPKKVTLPKIKTGGVDTSGIETGLSAKSLLK